MKTSPWSRGPRFSEVTALLLIAFHPGPGPAVAQTPPQIAVGWDYLLGLKSDGTATLVGQRIPGIQGWPNLVQVAAGDNHALGLTTTGEVVATGRNDSGECEVADWSGILQVAAANRLSLGLQSGGTVRAAGYILPGGAGDVATWTGIIQISAGNKHSLGLRADRTVVSTLDTPTLPSEVAGWTDVIQVAADSSGSSFGLRSDGTVLAAGADWAREATTWADIVQLSSRGGAVVGLRSDGTVVAAGSTYRGRNEVGGWSDIVQVSAGLGQTAGLRADGVVLTAPPLPRSQEWHGILQVATGWFMSFGLRVDGTIARMGVSDLEEVDDWTDVVQIANLQNGLVGLMGDGSLTYEDWAAEYDIAGLNDVVQVAGTGGSFFIALRANGTAIVIPSSWVPACAPTTEDLSTWSGLTQVAAGACHVAARRTDATVLATGDNRHGQCNVGGWREILQIAAAANVTAGLQTDGRVVATAAAGDVSTWTDISRVVVGDEGEVFGITQSGSVLVARRAEDLFGKTEVEGWTDIVDLSSLGGHTVGLKADGTAVAVGYAEWGECNVGDLLLTPTAGAPDLTASHLRLDPSLCPASIGLVARISNLGKVGDAPTVPIAFYRGETLEAANLLGVTSTTRPLGPVDFEDVTMPVSPALTGHERIWVVADDLGDGTGSFSEIAEANNTYQALAVGFCNLDVDLDILELRVISDDCPRTTLVRATVANRGSAPAPAPIDVAFYDGDPAAGGVLLGVLQTSHTIEPQEDEWGENLSEDLWLALTPPLTGLHTLCAVVDDDGTGSGHFPEVDEDNNRRCLIDTSTCLPEAPNELDYVVEALTTDEPRCDYPAINNLGEIVYTTTDAAGVKNLFSTTRGWLTHYASDTKGNPQYPDLNDSGEVVFREFTSGRILSTVRGELASQGFSPRINNSGEVVYIKGSYSIVSTTRGLLVDVSSSKYAVKALDLNDWGEVVYEHLGQIITTTRGRLGPGETPSLNNAGEVVYRVLGYGTTQIYSTLGGYVTKPSRFSEPERVDLALYGPEDADLLSPEYSGPNARPNLNDLGQVVFQHLVLRPRWNVPENRWYYEGADKGVYLATPFGSGVSGLRPVADAKGPYFFSPFDLMWRLDGTGSLNPDEGLSEPGSPGDTLAEYAWDLDIDGAFDDALGATPDARAFFQAAGPGTYEIRLRVTDTTAASYPSKGLPDLSDIAESLVHVVAPPEADAGGPYDFCPDIAAWNLDGSASINADDGNSEPGAPGDQIQEYAWDLDGDGVFDDAYGPNPEVRAIFLMMGPGLHSLGLRVTDTTATSFPHSGLGDLSGDTHTTLMVRDGSDPACGCTLSLIARAKPGKVDLAWTPVEAHHYNVYRGTTSGGPYLKVGVVTATAVFVDTAVVNGTTYAYVVRPADADDLELCQSTEASARPVARSR